MENSSTPISEPVLLTCWKDIAQYMGKGVRTVQRWEQTLDLPVRRPRGNAYKCAVIARPADLDLWLASRWSRRGEGEEHTLASNSKRSVTALAGTIKTSRQLRAEYHELLAGISSELQMLIRNCERMKACQRLELK